MDYPVYIYAEKVYHRDIRDYWMNKKLRRSVEIAGNCLVREGKILKLRILQQPSAVISPKQILRIRLSAAAIWFCFDSVDCFIKTCCPLLGRAYYIYIALGSNRLERDFS